MAIVTLNRLGFKCAVIAPSSVPRRTDDRVRTDRRDAQKLPRYCAAGLLTVVPVPDASLITVRSVVHHRVKWVKDLTCTKQRVILLLQSRGHVCRSGCNWTQRFWRWLNVLELAADDGFTLSSLITRIDTLQAQIRAVEQRITNIAQQPCYRQMVQELQDFCGISLFAAMPLVCEIEAIRRFANPTALMPYLGLVPSEHASGRRTRHGSITKSGNPYARKALIAAAWKYTHALLRSVALALRQKHCSATVIAIRWRARKRLHQRYQRLVHRKVPAKAMVAIARELTSFFWEAMQPVPPSDSHHRNS